MDGYEIVDSEKIVFLRNTKTKEIMPMHRDDYENAKLLSPGEVEPPKGTSEAPQKVTITQQ